MKTVLLVDDHPMVRKGTLALLQTLPQAYHCLEAGSRQEALQLLRGNPVEIAVVDLVLGGEDGLELIKEMTALYNQLKILALSMQPEVLYAERVVKAGALGMVSKSEPAETVLEAFAAVAAGEFFLSRASNAVLLKRLLNRKMPEGSSPVSRLSDRELHVFQLLGTGFSTAEIADTLSLSIKTIETHREKIKRKLALQDAQELVHAAKAWVTTGQPSSV